MVNKHIIIGNVGADPEIRATQSGDRIANLRVATSDHWRDKNGDRQERTHWHSVVIFGPLADVVEKYVRKGSKLYLEGSVQTRKWQDKSGNDRYSTETVLSGREGRILMLDGKQDGGERQQETRQKESFTYDHLDDELPPF